MESNPITSPLALSLREDSHPSVSLLNYHCSSCCFCYPCSTRFRTNHKPNFHLFSS